MKKEETRYTIRFCSADPRHKFAMDVLNAAGRRKATIIADAIFDYCTRLDGKLPEPTSAIKMALAGAPPKHEAQKEDLPAEKSSSIVEMDETLENSRKSDSMDDELRQTVLSGMSLFIGGT